MGRPRTPISQTKSTVYKGKDGRWHARVAIGRDRAGKQVRKHVSRRTKTETETAVREIERVRDTRQIRWTRSDPTLEEWMGSWLSRPVAMTLRPKTVASYTSALNCHVLPVLGGYRLSQVEPEMLEDLYLAMDQAGKSRHLIKAVHRVVRSCLNDAVRRRVISHNPALIARTPRLEPDEVQPLTPADVRRVLAVSASRRNALRCGLAFGHGPRQGEVLGLRWSDVDLETGEVQIRAQLQRQIWQHGCLLKAVD